MSSNVSSMRANITVGLTMDKASVNKLQDELTRINVGSKLNTINVNDEKVKKALTSVKQLQSALSASYSINLGGYDFNKFTNYLQKTGTSVKKLSQEFDSLKLRGQSSFATMSRTILSSQVTLEKHQNALQKYAQTFMSAAYWGAAYKAINSVSDSIRNAYQYTVDLDTSLNNIRIVTEKSSSEMERFARSANKAAQSLGVSTKAYTDASLIFYEQGLNDKQVKTRSDVTMKVSNVTGMGAAEAAENLTAVWNGFQVTTENAEKVVDQLAAVAANSASNLEELSTAMSKVASSANSMGVSSEQLTAQIATIEEATRQAPESIGTALKTVFARLGDLKVDGVDEFGTSLGEVSSQLKQMGIDVVDQYGNMREMGTIIEEVATKWNTWSSAQKQAAAIAMAGKRQYNNLFALFENWDRYTENLEIAQNSLGTLSKQQDIFLESTEGKLKQVRAKSEEFYSHLLDSKAINTAISGLDVLVTQLNGITSNPLGGLLPALFVVNKLLNGSISSGLAKIVTANTTLDIKMRQRQTITETIKATEEQIKNINSTEMSLLDKQANAYTANIMAAKEQAELARQSLSIREDLTAEQQQELILQEEKIAKLKEEAALAFEPAYAANKKAFGDKSATMRFKPLQNSFLNGTLDLQEIEKFEKKINEGSQKLIANYKKIEENSANVANNLLKVKDNTYEARKYLKDNYELTQEQADAIRKIVKEESDEASIQKKLVEYCEQQNIEIIRALASYDDLVIKMKQATQEAKNFKTNLVIDKVAINAEKRISSMFNTIGNMAMGISGLASAWDAFNSEDLSTFEKAEQMIISLSFSIPMLGSSIISIANGIKNFTVTQRVVNALVEEGIAIDVAKSASQRALELSTGKLTAAEIGEQLVKEGLITEDKKLIVANTALAASQATLGNSALGVIAKLGGLKAGLVAVEGGIYSLTTAGVVVLPVFAAIVAAIALVVVGIKSFENAKAQLDKNISNAEGIYQKQVELLKALKDGYDQVAQSIDSFKDKRSKIDDMVVGTQEWKDAVRDLNLEVIELIANNKDLADIYQKNSAGIYEINDKALNEYYEKQQNLIDTQAAMVNWTSTDVNKMQLDKLKKQYVYDDMNFRQKAAYSIGQIKIPFVGGTVSGMLPGYGAGAFSKSNLIGSSSFLWGEIVSTLVGFSQNLDKEMEDIEKSLTNIDNIKTKEDLDKFVEIEKATNKYIENLKTAYNYILPKLSEDWNTLTEVQQDLYSDILSNRTANMGVLSYSQGSFDKTGLYDGFENIEQFAGLKSAKFKKNVLKTALSSKKIFNEDLSTELEDWIDKQSEFNIASVLTQVYGETIIAKLKDETEKAVEFVTESGQVVAEAESEKQAQELLSSYTIMLATQLQYEKELTENISNLNETEIKLFKGIVYEAQHKSDFLFKDLKQWKKISNVVGDDLITYGQEFYNAYTKGLIDKDTIKKVTDRFKKKHPEQALPEFDLFGNLINVVGVSGSGDGSSKTNEVMQAYYDEFNKTLREFKPKENTYSAILSRYGNLTAEEIVDLINSNNDELFNWLGDSEGFKDLKDAADKIKGHLKEAHQTLFNHFENLYADFTDIGKAFEDFTKGMTYNEMEYASKITNKAKGLEGNDQKDYLGLLSEMGTSLSVEDRRKAMSVLANIDYSKYLHVDDFKKTLEDAGVSLDNLSSDSLEKFVDACDKLDVTLKLLNNTTDNLVQGIAAFKNISKDLKSGSLVSKDDYEKFINNLANQSEKQKVAALFAKTVNGQYMYIGEDVSNLTAATGMGSGDVESQMEQIRQAGLTYTEIFKGDNAESISNLANSQIKKGEGEDSKIVNAGLTSILENYFAEGSSTLDTLRKANIMPVEVDTVTELIDRHSKKSKDGKKTYNYDVDTWSEEDKNLITEQTGAIINALKELQIKGESGAYDEDSALTYQIYDYNSMRGAARATHAEEGKTFEGLTPYDEESSEYEKAAAIVFEEQAKALGATSAEFQTYRKSVLQANDALEESNDAIENGLRNIFLMKNGVKTLSSIWNSTYKDAKKGSQEYFKAIEETTSALRTVFGKSITEEFVIDNMDTIKKVAKTGSKEAVRELQDAVTKNIVFKASFDDNALKNDVWNLIKDINDEDYAIGTHIEFTGDWKERLNQFLQNAKMTAAEASSFFAGFGIEIDGLENVLDATTNKIIYSKISDSATGYTYTGASNNNYKVDSDSGKSKSKSSSSSSNHDFKKIEEQDLDIYYDINNQLKETNNILERIQKNAEQLVGQQAVDNLTQQNKMIDKQIKLNKEKIRINKQSLSDKKGQLIADFGATFDKNGYLSNYAEIDTKLYNENKALKEKWNKMSAKKQESKAGKKLEKQIDISDLKIENWDKQRKKYEEEHDLSDELFDELLELERKKAQNNLSKIDIRMDEKTIFGDLKRNFLDFDRSVNIATKDYAKLSQSHYKEAKSYGGEIKQRGKEITRLQNALDEISKSGSSKKYAKEVKDIREKLFSLMKDQEEALKSIHEAELSVVDDLANNFNEMSSELDRINTQFENIYSNINHYSDITKLLLGEEAYKQQDQFFKQREVVNKKQIQSLQTDLAGYKDERIRVEKQIAKATDAQMKEKLEDDLKNIEDKITSTTQTLQSTITRAFQNIIDGYKNSINIVYQELEEKMMGGFSFSTIESGLKKTKEYNDAWLDDAQAIYEKEKLANKFDELFNQTTSLEIQNQILDAKKEELRILEDIDKLSQYDIDRANAKLNLLMKEIALKEAQENKSKLRLRRDAQGNYSYQYTADSNATDKAKQEYEDAKFNLNKLDQDELIKIQERIFNLEKEAANELKAIDEDTYLSDEEKEQRRKTIMDKYEEDIQHEWELYDRAINRIYESSLPYFNKLNGTAYKNVKDMSTKTKSEFHDFIFDKEGLVPLNENGFELMSQNVTDWKNGVSTAIKDANTAFTDYQTKMNETAEIAGEDYLAIIEGDGEEVPGLKNVQTETEALKNKTIELKNAYLETSTEINNTLTSLQNLNAEIKTIDYTEQIKQINKMAKAYENMKTSKSKTKNKNNNPKSSKKTATNYESQIDSSKYKTTSGSGSSGSPKEEPIVPPPNVPPSNPDNGKKKYEEIVDDIANNGILGKGDLAVLGKKTKLRDELNTGFWAYKTKKDAINKNTKNAKWIWAYKDPKLGGVKDSEYLGSKLDQIKVSKVRDKAIEIEYGSNIGRGKGWPMREDPLKKTWLNRSDFEDQFYGYDTGGYTGAWGTKDGKIAMLHEKELVLNKEDTSNMLKSIGLLRDMLKGKNSLEIISNALDRTVNNLNSMTRGYNLNKDNSMNQSIVINADFPNVTARDEIEAAFASLENKATQYAWSNKLNV